MDVESTTRVTVERTPPWHRSEVYLFLRTDLILAVPFLRQCSPDIVHELVLRLREEVGRLLAPPRRLVSVASELAFFLLARLVSSLTTTRAARADVRRHPRRGGGS